MSQFYCLTCDRYRESNEEDHADYSGEPICGECVDDLAELAAEKFQEWQAAIDADTDYIEGQCNGTN